MLLPALTARDTVAFVVASAKASAQSGHGITREFVVGDLAGLLDAFDEAARACGRYHHVPACPVEVALLAADL